MNLDLLRLAARSGSGRRPVKWAQPQNIAVVELSAPATAPMVRGSQYSEAMPAAIMESSITDQVVDFRMANTRPRNSLGTWDDIHPATNW